MLVERFGNLLSFRITHEHARGTSLYRFVEVLTTAAFHEAQADFEAGKKVVIGEIGSIALPYEKDGRL
jgi:hypothetical protein